MPFISQEYYQALSPEKQRVVSRNNLVLGCHPDTQDYLLLPDSDRFAGTYVLGVQGTGKSSLLERMINHDMYVGNAVIVIDPHGDLIQHCIAQLPWARLSSTYLLDMEDESYPFGVNLFAAGKLVTDLQKTQAVERIMHVFEVLWSEVMTQQHLPRYVRAATIALLDNPGATLVDMHRFLTDDRTRIQMLRSVTDDSVKAFWEEQYNRLGDTERSRRVQPLMNRLEALFMGRSLVRNIVGQHRTSINFRKAIESRETILIRLPVKTLAQDARLVGSVIMSQIQQAVFSFANVPEKERPGVSIYVDEFQHFATSDFAELFTEGRKFGVKLVVAHQYRSQLPNFLQASTMTARTKVCFQLNPDDAREMAHVFPDTDITMKPEDMTAHPVEHLLTYGCDDPKVRAFIETYLRPLQSQRRGYRVEIKDTGFNTIDTMFDMVNGGRVEHLRVTDPTPYLDSLLYQVMCKGDYSLPIPSEAVIGFSNCGIGFFQQARTHASPGSDLLATSAKYPKHLLVLTEDGFRWTRNISSGMEQLYHFLFHLRTTMIYLAEHPIGKESTASRAEVATMLMNLPRRSAFVRTAETIGVAYTFNTPEEVSRQDFVDRLAVIRQQTRGKYCYPREYIENGLIAPEQENRQPSVPHTGKRGAPPVSRWEEM